MSTPAYTTKATSYAYMTGGTEYTGDPIREAAIEAGRTVVEAFGTGTTTPQELIDNATAQWAALSGADGANLYAATHETLHATPETKHGPTGWLLSFIVHDSPEELLPVPIGVIMTRSSYATDPMRRGPVTRELYAWVTPELRNQGIGGSALAYLVEHTGAGFEIPFPGDPATQVAAEKLSERVQFSAPATT